MRILIDTNIFLDVLLVRQPLFEESQSVIVRCGELKFPLFVAWHGLATAYYLLRKGRSEVEALADLDEIFAWATIAEPKDADARRARHLGFRDYEDALQAVSAESCGADCIITRNVSDFRLSAVAPIPPADFLTSHPFP